MSPKSLLLSLSFTLGFAASSHAADLQPLLVANQKSTIKVLLEVSGELKNVPYDIQFSEFPAAAPLGEALNAGAVDIGALGDAPYVFALGAGAPIKVVSILHAEGRYTTAILAPKDSPLNTACDLKGKRIATGRGSIGHHLALKALDQVGLTEKDVEFRFLGPVDAKIALANGSVDAWSTWEPYTALSQVSGQGRVLVNGRGLSSGNSFLAATDKALADMAVLQGFKVGDRVRVAVSQRDEGLFIERIQKLDEHAGHCGQQP